MKSCPALTAKALVSRSTRHAELRPDPLQAVPIGSVAGGVCPARARGEDGAGSRRSIAKRGWRDCKVRGGIEWEHIEGDGTVIFQHTCHLGHEGIVAKRKTCPTIRPFQSGGSKSKTRISPAMQRWSMNVLKQRLASVHRAGKLLKRFAWGIVVLPSASTTRKNASYRRSVAALQRQKGQERLNRSTAS